MYQENSIATLENFELIHDSKNPNAIKLIKSQRNRREY